MQFIWCNQARMMRQLQFVTTLADSGGRSETPPRPKKRKHGRNRFRLHRTNVAKRLRKMSDRIVLIKAKYLEACPFVGIIVDEGNNWSRNCPLYAATITCDREFRWRIQFVGQQNCEGRKDGEGVWSLVKTIFLEASLEVVYNNIFSAGTDGASVMRSTHQFRGWFALFFMFLFISYANTHRMLY